MSELARHTKIKQLSGASRKDNLRCFKQRWKIIFKIVEATSERLSTLLFRYCVKTDFRNLTDSRGKSGALESRPKEEEE
jgi:hypothetical protein